MGRPVCGLIQGKKQPDRSRQSVNLIYIYRTSWIFSGLPSHRERLNGWVRTSPQLELAPSCPLLRDQT